MKKIQLLALSFILFQLGNPSLLRAQKSITADITFGHNGVVIGPATAYSIMDMYIQADGKVVLSGSVGDGLTGQPVVIRLKANGKPDSTFGTNGYANLPKQGSAFARANGIKVLSSGKIVVACTTDSTSYVTRLNANGTTDATFGVNGYAVYENDLYQLPGQLLVLQDESMILTYTGYVSNNYVAILVKITASGTLDNAFGTAGVLHVSEILGYAQLLLDHNNRILVCGPALTAIDVVRLNANGTRDNTYGTGGLATVAVYDSTLVSFPNYNNGAFAVLLSDNSIVITSTNGNSGNTENAVTHVLPNGTQDLNYGQRYGMAFNNYLIYTSENSLTLDNNEILFSIYHVYSTPHTGIETIMNVINTNGSIDSIFPGKADHLSIQYDSTGGDTTRTYIACMRFLPNGQILGAGLAGVKSVFLARFNSAGFATGIKPVETPLPFSLYPNIANRYAMINYRNTASSPVALTVCDVSGKILLEKTLPAGGNQYKLETTNWSNGLYLVQLSAGKQISTKKLTVIH